MDGIGEFNPDAIFTPQDLEASFLLMSIWDHICLDCLSMPVRKLDYLEIMNFSQNWQSVTTANAFHASFYKAKILIPNLFAVSICLGSRDASRPCSCFASAR